MNIKVYQNRETHQIDNEVYGTQNENKVTTLKIEVPEQYNDWNKRIVFLTEEGNFWDYIKDDTYTIKNNITKYEELEAYIWLTENTESIEESVNDFRSRTFRLSFFANENADDLVPDEKQIDGFNSMLTVLNAEIEEVKQINTDFTKLKQEVEQSETERNNKLEETVNKITDMIEDYNDNAETQTNNFNENAEEQTNTYNSNAEAKKIELDNYTTNLETSLKNKLDTYAEGKEEELDIHKTTLETEMTTTKDGLVEEIETAKKRF